MELGDYLRVLKVRWVSVVVIALVTLAATAVATLLVTPQYTASTRLFFAVQAGESVADLAQGSSFTERQMSSYAEIARSPLTLEPVVDALDLSVDAATLASTLRTTVATGTTILVLAATHEDPVMARDIANAVADQLSATVGGLSPERPDGTESVRATTLSEAQLPTAPSSPNTGRNLAFGLVIGVLLGVGVAILREVLDTKVRDESDVVGTTENSVLTHVPKEDRGTGHPVFMHEDALGARSEAIRRLRTNLQFIDFGDRARSILITSSVPGEGKTTTAINLGASLADAGARVVLIDADLRRPAVAKYLGFEGRVGLTTVLIGRASVSDVLQPWQDTMLDVLASGQIPPNPSELLGSRAMSRLLTDLAATYDVIIIDSPPLLPVTDAAVLSKMVGGTLIVASAEGGTRKQQLRASVESLEQVGAHIAGIVLNKASRRDRSRYAYGYYVSDDDGVRRRPKAPANRRPAHASRAM